MTAGAQVETALAAVTGSGLLIIALIFIAGFWIAPIAIAQRITLGKGRGGTPGVLLGLFLGWLGVLVAAILSDQRLVNAELKKVGAYRECPHCKENMRRDASTCPHCRNRSDPWLLHQHLWWYQAADGWYWLNGDETEWVAWSPGEDEIGPPIGANPVGKRPVSAPTAGSEG